MLTIDVLKLVKTKIDLEDLADVQKMVGKVALSIFWGKIILPKYLAK